MSRKKKKQKEKKNRGQKKRKRKRKYYTFAVVEYMIWWLKFQAACTVRFMKGAFPDNSTCPNTETEITDPTSYLNRPRYVSTGPTSHSTDPVAPGDYAG